MKRIFNEDGLPLNINEIEFLSNKGSEFAVYRYLDSVIKIYKSDYQLSHLSLEELNILKKILTQRILLPEETLWNNSNELIGYKMPYVGGERSVDGDSVWNFFRELEILEQDLDLLRRNSVILRDINLSNTIYNGHINLIDPGNYLIDELDKVVLSSEMLNTNLIDSSILGQLKKIVIEGSYSSVKTLIDSLSLGERQTILNVWNYSKINGLINMLLFSNNSNIDPFQYRQIVNFITRERVESNSIYSLDVLKKFFDRDMCVGDAVSDFAKRYVKDEPKERKIFSFYNR